MKRIMVVLVLLLATWATAVHAQPATEWHNEYTNYPPGWQTLFSVVPTSDGGFVAAGAYDDATGLGLGLLMKFNSSGVEQWSKTYNNAGGHEWFNWVSEASDGGFYVCGVTGTGAPNGEQAWLIKVNSSGDQQWTREYGGPGWDSWFTCKQLSDGDLLMTGTWYSRGAGAGDAVVMKTSDNGATIRWSDDFGGTEDEWASDAIELPDGRFVFVGSTWSEGQGNSDGFLAFYSSAGVYQSRVLYGDTGYDDLWQVMPLPGGTLGLSGNTTSQGAGGSDIWYLRVDGTTGAVQAEVTHGTAGDDYVGLMLIQDAHVHLVGYIASADPYGWSGWFMRLNRNGVMLWDRVFSDSNRMYGVTQASDDDRVMVGEYFNTEAAGNPTAARVGSCVEFVNVQDVYTTDLSNVLKDTFAAGERARFHVKFTANLCGAGQDTIDASGITWGVRENDNPWRRTFSRSRDRRSNVYDWAWNRTIPNNAKSGSTAQVRIEVSIPTYSVDDQDTHTYSIQ